jgi:hypothetical protein
MRLRFLGFGAVIVAATVGVIAAQHSQATHSTQGHESRSHQFPHEMCGSHQAAGADSHHAEMSAALGLSAEQASAIERITSEACAAMAKYHEQIQAVLTPEQRAKMQEHHGASDHGDKAHSAPRRHGGK